MENPTTTENWYVADEYDDEARAALFETLKGLGYEVDDRIGYVAGSQAVNVWEMKSPAGRLRIESETYMGLSVDGEAGLVAQVKKAYEERQLPT